MKRPATVSPRLKFVVYLSSWIKPPPVDTDEDYIDDRKWTELYSPVGREENGELLFIYSKDQYQAICDMIDALDKKADDLMRTILTVFGAALAVATTRLIQFTAPWSYFAAIGLVALAFGIVIAAIARIPAPLETPMTPRELMAVSDLPMLPSKSQLHSAAAASYHLAFLGAKIMNQWKTTQLKRANWFFLTGLLVLPLCVAGNFWTAKQKRQGVDLKFELRNVIQTFPARHLVQRLSPPRLPGLNVDPVGTKVLKTVPLGCTWADPIRPPGTAVWPIGAGCDVTS